MQRTSLARVRDVYDVRGMQEGGSIFTKIGNWLKKSKIISTIGKVISPIVSILPIPGASVAGAALGAATALASQKGFGRGKPATRMTMAGKGLPKKIKAISRNQIEALKRGLGKRLKSGAISLLAGKALFPNLKNITALQMKALAALRGRNMAGGGVSLAGGKHSGYPMSGMGFSGQGVKLAGMGKVSVQGYRVGKGASLAGGRLPVIKKKPKKKPKPKPRKRVVYR